MTVTVTHKKEKCIIKKVFFFTDVLAREDYNRVLDECLLLTPYLKEESSKEVKRKKIVPGANSYLYTVFYGIRFLHYLHTILGFKLAPSNSLPIEFRVYENGGQMDWHRDVVDKVVRTCPQIEIVFTLENNSDSKTVWKDDETQETHEVVTQNNSILITQGNGAYHMVTPVTRGSRSIVKIAYDVV
jgi:hypothetical protein